MDTFAGWPGLRKCSTACSRRSTRRASMRRTPGATSLPWTLAIASTVILGRAEPPGRASTERCSTASGAGLPSQRARAIVADSPPATISTGGLVQVLASLFCTCAVRCGLLDLPGYVPGVVAAGSAAAMVGTRNEARATATKDVRTRIGKPPCRTKSHSHGWRAKKAEPLLGPARPAPGCQRTLELGSFFRHVRRLGHLASLPWVPMHLKLRVRIRLSLPSMRAC